MDTKERNSEKCRCGYDIDSYGCQNFDCPTFYLETIEKLEQALVLANAKIQELEEKLKSK